MTGESSLRNYVRRFVKDKEELGSETIKNKRKGVSLRET